MCIYLNVCFIQIECVIGWYGENCNRRCAGHCKDGTTCNHVTGQCNEGCDTGWTGYMCDKGIFFSVLQNITFYIRITLFTSHNKVND